MRSVVPWLLGWAVVAALGACYWCRLKRPERRLKYGGVVQRRSYGGLFVPGRSEAEVAENLTQDTRFHARRGAQR